MIGGREWGMNAEAETVIVRSVSLWSLVKQAYKAT